MIYIGTSGFNYKHWKNRFYPGNLSQKNCLEYYSSYFATVELNVTFYRLPDEKSFAGWYLETPENFVFAVKGSRYITQSKKLKEPEQALANFMENASGLKEKLKVILWQFPPNFGINLERLENFLRLLQNYPYANAFEFRHESWFSQDLYDLLRKYNSALVIADSPKGTSPQEITANFVYIRFHGGKILYGSEYSSREISSWAKKINEWSNGNDVFVYFNNDAFAFAVKNALSLKSKFDNR